jgi:hypothetical protein
VDLSRWISYWNSGDILGAPLDPHIIHGTKEDYLDIQRDDDVDVADLNYFIRAWQGTSPFTKIWKQEEMNEDRP